MSTHARQSESHLYQLRLLLEELCCDLCRFEHVAEDGCRPESVQIEREFQLGTPGVFADMRVIPEGKPAYFVEVKYGYSNETLQRRLQQKYGSATPGSATGSKVVLVIDLEPRPNWASIAAELKQCMRPGLELEIWDEPRLFTLTRERFQTEFHAITTENLLSVREAIDRAKGFHAFQARSFEEYEHDPLKAELLWHFGFWRLRQLRERGRLTPGDTLPPGAYRGVAVLIADLCSFSSYVRDTPDSEIIREGLTSFYSKARYQIINNGGMLYQFVGDQVIGFFGMPEANPGYVSNAFSTAQALVCIGQSVSHHWQRRIDRMQTSCGVHIGMAVGDVHVVSLRPFDRLHTGAIGDCINVAARLMSVASESDIVVSNSFYRKLPEEAEGDFREVEPIEARNVGRIKAWKFHPDREP